MAELTTVQTARDLGLLEDEYMKIKEILGRTPNFTELSIFSVMWSEHCSYKNSIVLAQKNFRAIRIACWPKRAKKTPGW